MSPVPSNDLQGYFQMAPMSGPSSDYEPRRYVPLDIGEWDTSAVHNMRDTFSGFSFAPNYLNPDITA